MNPNLPPIGKCSSTTIDRDALCRVFNVPAGLRFNDRTINLWLSQSVPGMENYQTSDTLDMGLLRWCMVGGQDAGIEAINESLSAMAAALDGIRDDADATTGTDQPAKIAAGTSAVPAAASPCIIGMSAPASSFRTEVAARLRKAGF